MGGVPCPSQADLFEDRTMTSFVTWTTGLIERVEKAERKEKLRRAFRRMALPREKKRRLWNRYQNLLMKSLGRDDPISNEEYHDRIALQQHLNKEI